MGVEGRLDLCSEFAGAIDQFRISRQVRTVPYRDDYLARSGGGHANIYPRDGGRFESPVIRARPGAAFQSLGAITGEPPETLVQLFVRAGDDQYRWTADDPPWVPVRQGVPVGTSVRGEYFQVAANLYPDGDGTRTPSVSEVTLVWQETEPPLPPFTVQAQGEDGSVTVTWVPSVDKNAQGYYIYYGERPGEYLGSAATQGTSPIAAGAAQSLRLTGLQNGKIYYFAVAAVSAGGSTPEDAPLIGDLSREVSARPLPGVGTMALVRSQGGEGNAELPR
jgi:hypothetical protein